VKRLALAVTLSLVAGDASAISRYDVGNKSCAEVQGIVLQQGAAIIRWRSKRTSMTLYDRFVRDRRWCYADQTTDVRRVPTVDGSCPMLKCVEIDDFFDR
jgi:hypothetical protein